MSNHKKKKLTPEQRAAKYRRNVRRGREAALEAARAAREKLELQSRAAASGIVLPGEEEADLEALARSAELARSFEDAIRTDGNQRVDHRRV